MLGSLKTCLLGGGRREEGKAHAFEDWLKGWDCQLSIFPSSHLHQQSLLTLQGTLQPEPPQDARFGFAMGALPDLNQDGFADVAVGAPLEDVHRGALYLYHGTQSGVKPHPAQVRCVQIKQGHGGRKGKGRCALCLSVLFWVETQIE